jgi:hypothetical protein
MALGRTLAGRQAPGLRLRALAPVSGVLALARAELPSILDGGLDGRVSAYNVSALLTSWQPIYGLYASPAGVYAATPAAVSGLVTPAFLARLRHPDGGLLRGLRANDTVCAWRPPAPIRLFAARGDRAVTIANTRLCARALLARCVRADVIDLGAIDHFPSMFAATPKVLAWFDQLTRARYP